MRACPVLVVDDDAAIRETLLQLLEEEGYAVELAADGIVALDILRRAPDPMVVLLDLMMPRLDGYRVLDVVMAEAPSLQRHRYVVMTASASALTEPLCLIMERLCATSILKPFNIDHLLDLVAASASGLPE